MSPLCVCKVLIGDPQQLPAFAHSATGSRAGYTRSLLQRLMHSCNHGHTLLATQYRMHPAISRFPFLHFYDGKVADSSTVTTRRSPLQIQAPPDNQLSDDACTSAAGRMPAPPPLPKWLVPYAFLDVRDGAERMAYALPPPPPTHTPSPEPSLASVFGGGTARRHPHLAAWRVPSGTAGDLISGHALNSKRRCISPWPQPKPQFAQLGGSPDGGIDSAAAGAPRAHGQVAKRLCGHHVLRRAARLHPPDATGARVRYVCCCYTRHVLPFRASGLGVSVLRHLRRAPSGLSEALARSPGAPGPRLLSIISAVDTVAKGRRGPGLARRGPDTCTQRRCLSVLCMFIVLPTFYSRQSS